MPIEDKLNEICKEGIDITTKLLESDILISTVDRQILLNQINIILTLKWLSVPGGK